MQRLGQQTHRTFTQRLLGDEGVQLGDGRAAVAGGDQTSRPFLGGDDPQLLDPPGQAERPPLLSQRSERTPSPQRQRPAVERGRGVGR